MKIAWGITGAGHFLLESFEVFKKLKKSTPDLKVTTLVSRAGEEVVRMYGLENDLKFISDGSYLEEIFLESGQGASVPKTGRFLLGKYDALIISPATSNTTAKLACGIADTLITNAVAQAAKGGVPVYIVPVDISGEIESRMPFFIDREICMKCEICPPADKCPEHAITDQIDLLKCTGCSICMSLCSYGAIRGGLVKLKVRDVDAKNVSILRKLEGVTVLETPQHIFDISTKKHAKIEVLKDIKGNDHRGHILFPNKKVQTLIGTRVQVEMKGDKNTLEGKLESVDDNLNLHLIDTFEIANGIKSRSLGSVVLRGNNIILMIPVGE